MRKHEAKPHWQTFYNMITGREGHDKTVCYRFKEAQDTAAVQGNKQTPLHSFAIETPSG